MLCVSGIFGRNHILTILHPALCTLGTITGKEDGSLPKAVDTTDESKF